MAVLEGYDLPDELVAGIKAILEPKSGAKSINIDEVTKKDEEGNIVAILDTLTGLWLPADDETFYVDKSGKGIPVGDIHLKRVSKAAYAILSKHKKANAASKEAIFGDVLEGVISPEEGKQLVEDIEASEPDYSALADLSVA
jgi:hypothetical protein